MGWKRGVALDKGQDLSGVRVHIWQGVIETWTRQMTGISGAVVSSEEAKRLWANGDIRK